uniref:Uncharacterized protein n=1 Tax=viral metagenome TaxID=1070528 RepID=A0A6C0JWP2_9ZZZZ
MSRYFDNKELFVGPTTKQYGSHMVTTNVIKETKIKYINIDSRFRDDYNYSNLANYYFTLPERINDVKTVSICNIELPLSVFNISSDLGNNYFQVYRTSSAIDSSMVDISYGFYQLTPFYGNNPLKTEINASLANKGVSNLTIDFSNNYNNGTTTINTYNGYYAQLKNTGGSPLTVNFAVSSTGSFDKYNLKSKMGWLLGFHDLSYTIPSGGTIYSDSFVNLHFPRYLYVVLDEFSRGNQSSFISPLPSSLINKNIIARISIDYKKYDFGDIVVGNQFNGVLLSDNRSYTGKTDLQKLNVQIVNEWGIPVNLNGLDFSFTIVVEHE